MGKRVGKVPVQVWVSEAERSRWQRALQRRFESRGIDTPTRFLSAWIRAEINRIADELGEPPVDDAAA